MNVIFVNLAVADVLVTQPVMIAILLTTILIQMVLVLISVHSHPKLGAIFTKNAYLIVFLENLGLQQVTVLLVEQIVLLVIV